MMETHPVHLEVAVFEKWTALQQYLGFINSSHFAEHILEAYKIQQNLTDKVIGDKNEDETIINGVKIKKEFTEAESYSCDSADTSGKGSPELSIQHSNGDSFNYRHHRRKHRGSWGLESVVRRLHQARVENADDDGWIQDGNNLPAYQQEQGMPLLKRIKQEITHVDGYDEYRPPMIVPDSARSVPVLRDENYLSSPCSLRTLLERPPVNASAALRQNAAELEERGVVINPAISYDTGQNRVCDGSHGDPPVYVPINRLPSEVQDHSRTVDIPAGFALESLIRMALLAKEDEGTSKSTRASKTEMEVLRSVQEQGIRLGSFQNSLPHIPQAFNKAGISVNVGQSSPLRGGASSEIVDAPSLKNILQGGGDENKKPEMFTSKKEDEIGNNSYGMASAASALQHLAQMQGPVTGETKLTGHRKGSHHKRHKRDKQRRRHGSDDGGPPAPPTVKFLLEKKREGAVPSKYRNRIKDRKKKSHTMGKKRKMSRKTPMKILPKFSIASSLPMIDISASASQVMKLITDTGALPALKSHDISSSHKSSSPPLNNSASEVMKLLASKNQAQSMISICNSSPPHQRGVKHAVVLTVNKVKSSTPPPSSDGSGKPAVGAADIMKHLATSYSSQNTPQEMQYPFMFANPSATESSSAFSLMKQLITKNTS